MDTFSEKPAIKHSFWNSTFLKNNRVSFKITTSWKLTS